jgi:hypothetical protein
MAKTYDWDELLKQYATDYELETISPAEWCERVGLSYSSAKRYITVKAAKNHLALRNSQAKKKPKPGRDERGYFLKGHQIPECTQGADNLTPFEKGNQAARTHGGYATLIKPEDLEIGDESELIGLIAERRMFRARLASALRTVTELEAELATPEGRDDPDKVASSLRLIRGANAAINNAALRIESLTKTISSIRIDDVNVPRLKADHSKIEAQTEKLKAETDKLGRKSTADSVVYQLDW